MKSVRMKLVAIVALCVCPALIAAVLRTRESERELRDQVKNRVDVADDAFAADLDENLASTRIILRIAAADEALRESVKAANGKKVLDSLPLLRGTYLNSAVFVFGSTGQLLASTSDIGRPGDFPIGEFAPLLGGKSLSSRFRSGDARKR